MPAYDSQNVIVGAAVVLVGPSGHVTAPTPASQTGWTNVGFTQEGVEVSYEPDYGDVEVDQLMDSARIFKQGMRVTVNTTLAEATLENLLIVWGQSAAPVAQGTGASATATVNVNVGRLGDAPLERGLYFVGPAPKGNGAQTMVERRYHLYRAIQTESTSFALRRSEATGLPASFRCLPYSGPETSATGARYGTIVDAGARSYLDVI